MQAEGGPITRTALVVSNETFGLATIVSKGRRGVHIYERKKLGSP